MNSCQPFVFRDGINSPVESHWRNVLGVVPNIAAASPIFTNLRSITTDYVRLWENTTIGLFLRFTLEELPTAKK